MKKIIDAIMNALKSMEDDELVSVWNEYCDAANYFDDKIYSMDELDELYQGSEPSELLRRAFYGHDQFGDDSEFNPNRDYFTFNGYGNLISIESVGWNGYANRFMFDGFDEDALAEYIADNRTTFDNDTLEDVFAEVVEGME